MPPTPASQAVLLAVNIDILPFSTDEGEPESDGDLPVTRTTASNEYALTLGTCWIGRDPACQVQINERRTDVSRKHASVQYENNGYVIYDHSRNGTFINGQQIAAPYYLINGDVIGLAHTQEMLHFIDRRQPAPPQAALTDREQEIVRLLAAGHRAKDIATTLKISQHTVNSHIKNLYHKLGVRNRAEAIAQANKLRLL